MNNLENGIAPKIKPLFIRFEPLFYEYKNEKTRAEATAKRICLIVDKQEKMTRFRQIERIRLNVDK